MNNTDYFKLDESWGDVKNGSKLVLYGAGRIGRRVLPVLSQEFSIPFLLDKGHVGEEVCGIEVKSPSQGLDDIRKSGTKIVVATMKGAYADIVKDLEAAGLVEYHDFCIFERFAQEWNLRRNNRCVLAKIDTVITSRCTLNCRNCNMFISHTRNRTDFDQVSLKNNFDIFFDSVDFVYEYTLLGGEPFAHKGLTEIILYLEEKYGDRIGKLNLISNGTVVPDQELLQLLKNFQISVHISDYTVTVNYRDRLKQVAKAFDDYQIEYYVIPNNVWKDICYPDKEYCAENPAEHMQICGHSTHSVNNGRLYWCDPAFAAEEFLGFPSETDDYLDLEKNRKENSKYDASLNIFRYLLGDVNDRGYMSFCEHCAGIGNDNQSVVTAGLQK